MVRGAEGGVEGNLTPPRAPNPLPIDFPVQDTIEVVI